MCIGCQNLNSMISLSHDIFQTRRGSKTKALHPTTPSTVLPIALHFPSLQQFYVFSEIYALEKRMAFMYSCTGLEHHKQETNPDDKFYDLSYIGNEYENKTTSIEKIVIVSN